MLGTHDSIKFKGEDNYEWVVTAGGPISISRDELIRDLKSSIEEARQKYRSLDEFDHFLMHLEAEEASYEDLNGYVETHPMELVNLLKILVSRKTFKGTCPVCESQR